MIKIEVILKKLGNGEDDLGLQSLHDFYTSKNKAKKSFISRQIKEN